MITTWRYGAIEIVEYRTISQYDDILVDALMVGDDWYAIYQVAEGYLVAVYEGSTDEIIDIVVM